MRNILEIKNLVVSYGGIEAVEGIDLKVEEGKIVTLIGSNGAGKSTTLKAVAGLVRPKSGEILLNDANLVGKSTDQIVSSGVTLVPEGRRVFENLTVAENLRIGAYLRKDPLADDLARVYDLFPRLKERAWQQAGTLSGGEQQMLAVGRALMAKPKLIMMDEPSLGLAPIVVRGIFEIIREINRQGITVLLIEQNAKMALLKIADWAYVMQTGCRPHAGSRRRAGRQRGGQGRVSRHGKIKDAIPPGSRRRDFCAAPVRAVCTHLVPALPIARSGCFVLNWIKFSGESKYGSVNHESGTEKQRRGLHV